MLGHMWIIAQDLQDLCPIKRKDTKDIKVDDKVVQSEIIKREAFMLFQEEDKISFKTSSKFCTILTVS